MAIITGGGLPAGGDAGPPGKDGASAYEVAVEQGFAGSEQDWLDSLVSTVPGPPGADGMDGAAGPPGGGVPTGGLTGQVLAKASGDDYATSWIDADTGGAGVPLGTIIPWALPWNPTDAPDDYSNVTNLAPHYLPCTGVVYPATRAPDLYTAIEHRFVDGGLIGDDGDYISGETLHHIDPSYEKSWIYKRVGDGEVGTSGVTADPVVTEAAFCTPDLRGRSPIGSTTIGDNSYKFDGDAVKPVEVGERLGDKRVGDHAHGLNFSNGTHAAMTPNPGTSDRTVQYKSETSPWNGGSNNEYMIAERASRMHSYHSGAPGYENYFVNQPLAFGAWGNIQPSTGVNFLIFCGVSGSATPSTRSGEVHRLHPVSTAHMIRQQLADPNLPDEEREFLEAQLNGDPWPPIIEETGSAS